MQTGVLFNLPGIIPGIILLHALITLMQKACSYNGHISKEFATTGMNCLYICTYAYT